MSIAANLQAIKSSIPPGVKLIAISKTQTVEEIIMAYQAGQRAFGENRAQEIAEKQPRLPKDIEWHFVGHLQTNKVKYITPFVSMIQSVDSLKLMKEINAEARKNNRVIDCLLEFRIASEETKYGFNLHQAKQMIEHADFRQLTAIRVCGVMGMATFTDDMKQVKEEFRLLKNIFIQLKTTYFSADKAFSEISMGMSNDYLEAIELGSTIVRIGTSIFGERTKNWN